MLPKRDFSWAGAFVGMSIVPSVLIQCEFYLILFISRVLLLKRLQFFYETAKATMISPRLALDTDGSQVADKFL